MEEHESLLCPLQRRTLAAVWVCGVQVSGGGSACPGVLPQLLHGQQQTEYPGQVLGSHRNICTDESLSIGHSIIGYSGLSITEYSDLSIRRCGLTIACCNFRFVPFSAAMAILSSPMPIPAAVAFDCSAVGVGAVASIPRDSSPCDHVAATAAAASVAAALIT